MSQHLSKETWTIIEGEGSLLHIETSSECEVAGRHICSINKKDDKVATLIMLSPELLDLLYDIVKGRLEKEKVDEKACELYTRFHTNIQ
jgi:hypothetical protein